MTREHKQQYDAKSRSTKPRLDEVKKVECARRQRRNGGKKASRSPENKATAGEPERDAHNVDVCMRRSRKRRNDQTQPANYSTDPAQEHPKLIRDNRDYRWRCASHLTRHKISDRWP
jgi:hypothetical protein